MHLCSYLCSQRHISIREQPSCSNMTDQALTHLTIIQRDDTVYLTVTGTPLYQSLTEQFGTAAVACSTINRQHYRCRCLLLWQSQYCLRCCWCRRVRTSACAGATYRSMHATVQPSEPDHILRCCFFLIIDTYLFDNMIFI